MRSSRVAIDETGAKYTILQMHALYWGQRLHEKAAKFNGEIGRWSTSQLQVGRNMLSGCATFDRALKSWDVQQLREASGMFFGASAYNEDLCVWADQLSNVTTVGDMFRSTACPAVGDPRFTLLRKGPLCWECPSSRPKVPSITEGPTPVPLIPAAIMSLPDGRILMWADERRFQTIKDKNDTAMPAGTFTSIYDPAAGNTTLLRVESAYGILAAN